MLIENKGVVTEGRLLRILRLDAEGYDFINDPGAAVATLRQSPQPADIFTFVPRVTEIHPKHPFHWKNDNFAVLPVSTYDHWVKQQIDYKTRNKVRKSVKAGVVVHEIMMDDTFIHGISSIYNESPVRQGKHFWHYKKTLESVRSMNSTFMDRSIFLGAYLDNILIGFVKMVVSEDGTQAGLMQILSLMSQRDKAPTNALIAQAVRSCASRSIPNLWYANFTYGKKQQDGLTQFKYNNGFRKVDVPRYFVPLTQRGKVAMHLGLHQRSIDWVPDPIAAQYRRLRSSWYEKKLSSVNGVSQSLSNESRSI